MTEYRNEALKKLQEGAKNGRFDRYASAMKVDVLRQLESFVEQDDEFAQAVVQGGSFEDCMKAVAKSGSTAAEKKIAAANAETERIRAELEEARKQLKASAADVAKFGVWFTTVQQDFLKMMSALREVMERNEATGKKLKTGAVALLNDLLERLNQEETEKDV